MVDLNDHFTLLISENNMAASIQLFEDFDGADLTKEDIQMWLKSNDISHGIIEDSIEKLVNEFDSGLFPLQIAKGTEPLDGVDGEIDFVCDQDDNLNFDDRRNFRDVKRIPSLEVDEKIAVVTDPVEGKPGYDISGKVIPYRKPRAIKMRAGKNVAFNTEDNTFYSEVKGKLSLTGHRINVHNTFEVNEDLSMSTGNINFVGSIIIRGNVPSGYRVEAEGDIHIYGLVEASFIKAGGNVTISEGISGLKKGSIIAGGDINIGYINQAKIEAENNIIVHNSIMHSQCLAKGHIYCHSGSIIGGVCSAGITIEANEVGNRMDTKTEIAIGVNQEQYNLESQYQAAKTTLLNEIEKINTLGESLAKKAESSQGLTSQERILLLKQRNTLQITEDKLAKVDELLQSLEVEIGDEEKARLIVKKVLYPNVDLQFGKYHRTTDKLYKYIQVYLENGEIDIKSL